MNELLAQVPGGPRTVFGVAVLLIVVVVAKKLLGGGDKPSQHHRVTTCRQCGWKGEASAYRPKCPKCGITL